MLMSTMDDDDDYNYNNYVFIYNVTNRLNCILFFSFLTQNIHHTQSSILSIFPFIDVGKKTHTHAYIPFVTLKNSNFCIPYTSKYDTNMTKKEK